MPGIPNRFITTAESITTFNWSDLASKIGYIIFYGCAFNDSSGSDVYFLIPNTTLNSPTRLSRTSTPINETTTVTFDYTFSKSMYVKAAPFYCNCTIEGDNNTTSYVEAEVYHYDGSTETLLGEDKCSQKQGQAIRHLVYGTLSSGHKFSVGDILRIKLKVYVTTADGYLWHDPSSLKTFTEPVIARTIGSDMQIHIPFLTGG